jgi:hypothetical protein
MSIDTCEPAFPGPADVYAFSGMSLLDYFAAKAMHAHALAYWQYWYNNKNDEDDTSEKYSNVDISVAAYSLAIAMIEEKNDIEGKPF